MSKGYRRNPDEDAGDHPSAGVWIIATLVGILSIVLFGFASDFLIEKTGVTILGSTPVILTLGLIVMWSVERLLKKK